MPSSKYLMSFTTGGLFYQESVSLTNLYLDKRNWQEVKETAISDNLLQARTKGPVTGSISGSVQLTGKRIGN